MRALSSCVVWRRRGGGGWWWRWWSEPRGKPACRCAWRVFGGTSPRACRISPAHARGWHFGPRLAAALVGTGGVGRSCGRPGTERSFTGSWFLSILLQSGDSRRSPCAQARPICPLPPSPNAFTPSPGESPVALLCWQKVPGLCLLGATRPQSRPPCFGMLHRG